MSDILSHVLRSDPNWTLLPANVPHRIQELLKLCLQKDAKKRRQTATDVRIDMEQALAEPVAVAPVAAPSRASRMGWIVAFAPALLVAAALAFVHFREVPPLAPPETRTDIATPVQFDRFESWFDVPPPEAVPSHGRGEGLGSEEPGLGIAIELLIAPEFQHCLCVG